MYSRRRNYKSDSYKLLSKETLYLAALGAVIIGLLCFFFYTGINHSSKISFAKSVSNIAENNAKEIFKVDKIVLYSSCDATTNESINQAFWNLNIHQYTDIAIYLKYGDDSKENIIKELYIDQISFQQTPNLGDYGLYYKDLNYFGKLEVLPETKIEDCLKFNIINTNEPLDTSYPNIDNALSTPITLEYLNKNMKENYSISNEVGKLIFDGSLLKKSFVTPNSLKATISFNINIINQSGELFICNVCTDIPLDNIYEGSVKKELNDLTCRFFKGGNYE